MRFRAGSTLIYPLLLAITVSSGLVLNAGCGGGSSSPKPSSSGSPTPTPSISPSPSPSLEAVTVKPAVLWAARSRQAENPNVVSGPASALSVVIRMFNVGSSTPRFEERFNRGVGLSGGREIYTTTAKLTPGLYNFSAEFHANANGTGPVVGTAAAGATVNTDGSLSITVATFGTVQNVEVVAGQSVKIGETKPLLYSAKDGGGNVVAVTPGSGFIQIVDATSASQSTTGQATVAVQGEEITGVNPFQAKVQVTVDNKVSPATLVKVLSNVTLDVTPKNSVISIGLPAVFSATVGNDGPPSASGVKFSVKQGDIAGALAQPNATTASLTASRNEGDYTLVATSNYDPNVVVEIPFKVQSLVQVAIAPETIGTVSFKGGQVQLSANVSQVPQGQDATVTWSIDPANAGTISADGLFTAGQNPGTVKVRATSRFDNRKFAEKSFQVASLAAVRITSTTPVAPISIKSPVTLTAAVDNVPAGQPTTVTWSVQGGDANGTITGAGVYTAPATPGDYTVIATSVFDPTKTATVVVPVRSFVTVTLPDQPDLSIKDTRTLAATVGGVPTGGDFGVTWSRTAAPGTPAGADLGTIDATTGVYTAPAAPVNIIVTATSRFDPTKSASKPLAVKSFVGITLTPPDNTVVSINARRQYTAAVAGIPTGGDAGVTWRVLEANGGTISATGLYSAPATAGDFTIEATSNFDPLKKQTVKVRVRSGNLGVGVN